MSRSHNLITSKVHILPVMVLSTALDWLSFFYIEAKVIILLLLLYVWPQRARRLTLLHDVTTSLQTMKHSSCPIWWVDYFKHGSGFRCSGFRLSYTSILPRQWCGEKVDWSTPSMPEKSDIRPPSSMVTSFSFHRQQQWQESFRLSSSSGRKSSHSHLDSKL